MRERASRRKQMHYLGSVRHQPVGDVRAVAIGRVAFSAHDADAVRARRQGLGGFAEARGLHVLLVGHLAVAAECLALPFIGDTGLGERGAERFARELRMAPGPY